MSTSLNVNVMRRFLTEEQFQSLLSSYKKARKTNNAENGIDRAENLDQPITQNELEVLRAYLFDTYITMRELAEDFGYKSDAYFYHTAARTALKYLRQKGDVLSHSNG